MRQNVIKRNTAESRANKQGLELIHALSEIERLRRELQTEIDERRTLEKKLANRKRLQELVLRNFPETRIFVFDQDFKNLLSEGAPPDPFLPFNDDLVMKLRKTFEGEGVHCEVSFSGRFYHVTTVPLASGGNPVKIILCVVRDFTERKAMEEGLVNALKKERELGELKSRFVTMASHEFRTPLTMILSSTFLIEKTSPENYETEKMVHTNRIKRAVNNLTLILNEFLSLEKLEQNKVEVVNSDVNIPEFIQDTLSEMDIIKREGQVIKYNHSGDQWMSRIDHHLFWSIVTNLVSNSLKYSKSGDTIEITSEIGPGSIVFIVKDQGIGIPDDEQQFIFGRFFRARNAINIEGTGLGLHIIQKYIHLLKGTITFESQLDVGTTFTVILPATIGESIRAAESSKSLQNKRKS
ncbi:MAG: HAMP domain-containing histidine kinase [Bacteroidetes bacterium]|nr:HAMP domain-containing histidine kinase [Bacteroidota bacterium]